MPAKKPKADGSYGSTDWSTRPGVQTYDQVHGNQRPELAGALRLADVLEQLGHELRDAQVRATKRGEPDLLKLKDATVELALTWESKGSGGIEFWVLKLGGEVARNSAQTVTVTVEPSDDVVVYLRDQD